jgi:hypothetical protein
MEIIGTFEYFLGSQKDRNRHRFFARKRRDDETDSRKDELALLSDMSAPIQNQNPMVELTSTEHSRRHREREKKRKNQPDHASTDEAQQQRSIPLTETERKRRERALNARINPMMLSQRIGQFQCQALNERVVNVCRNAMSISHSQKIATGTHLNLRIYSNNINEIFSQ